MPEQFAIKRSDAWLWSGSLSRAEVVDRFQDGLLTGDWLVCPVGYAGQAVPVHRFVHEPDVFVRERQRERGERKRRKSVVESVEQPLVGRIGKRMLAACLLCLLVGRAIVTILFPHLRGARIPPMMWFVLVPIWATGICGLVFVIFGWIQRRFRIHKSLRKIGAAANDAASRSQSARSNRP